MENTGACLSVVTQTLYGTNKSETEKATVKDKRLSARGRI